jgi:cellulose synthase/poly-beta-1,6-N-acetylglucosamine synthase-like glycosyltransferase
MEIARTNSSSPALSGSEERSSAVAGVTADPPVISVVVPVRNSPEELRLCLEHLAASTFASYEVIVVDDASTDETAKVAIELGARLLHLDQRQGPAEARNRGAEIARGEYLLFLDADVCAHPDTLQLVADTFAQDPGLDAVFGSYDTQPTAKNVLSEYKNLFHHFVHQDSREQATTFWSGCGAIRRTTFVKMGGFSRSYGRPCIEDIELGRRLHKAGYRILLNKRLQVTHLKRWTLWSIVKTDVLDRGIPWTELMLREGSMPNDLNVKYSQRISVVLAYGLLGILGIGVWHYRNLMFVPLFLLVLISVMDYWSTRRRFTPAVRILMAFAGLSTLAIVGYIFKYWPLLPLALIVGIVAINFRFYAFFLRKRHLLLICLVIPLHLLYYLYSGLAFAFGLALHMWKNLKGHGAKAAEYPPIENT